MLHLCFLFCVRFQWLLYLVLWFCFSILFFYPTSETESVLISMLICVCNNVSFCARCRDTFRRKIEWWIFLSVSSTGMKVTKISESKKYSRNFLENITIYMENWNLRNGKVQSLIDNSDKFPSISDMINWEILGSFLYHSNLVYFKLGTRKNIQSFSFIYNYGSMNFKKIFVYNCAAFQSRPKRPREVPLDFDTMASTLHKINQSTINHINPCVDRN